MEAATLGRAVMADFLRSSRAYDIIPESGKVVVFDTSLPIGLAFYALVEHDTACSPLWDSVRGDYAGTLTTSDMCDIVRMFHSPTAAGRSATVDALKTFTIAAWREYAGSIEGIRRGLSSPELSRSTALDVDARRAEASAVDARASAAENHVGASGVPSSAARSNPDAMELDDASSSRRPSAIAALSTDVSDVGFSRRLRSPSADTPVATRRRANRVHTRLISIDPEDDLFTVSVKFRAHSIHHMPVLDVDQNAVIAILSYISLVSHIVRRFSDHRRLFELSLVQLGIGTYRDIVVVPDNASIISVLNVLAERRISSVPVVATDTGAVVDVYSRDDVLFLATDPTLAVLDAPVGLVLRFQVQQTGIARPVVTCSRNDSLHTALQLFAASGCRAERLVCVDEERRVTGIVSLSDVFAFFTSDGPLRPAM